MSAWQPLRLGARVEHHGEEQWNTQTTSSKAKSAVECGETTRGSGAIKTVGRAWSTWLGIDYRQIDNESSVWSSRCGYK